MIVFVSMAKMPFDMFDLMQNARMFLAQDGALLLQIGEVDFARLIELEAAMMSPVSNRSINKALDDGLHICDYLPYPCVPFRPFACSGTWPSAA